MNDKNVLANHLKQNPIFSDFSEGEMEHVSKIIDPKHLAKGEMLFEIEKSPRFLFYVIKGELELTLVDDDVKILSQGEIIGEVGLLHGEFRTGIVIAKTDVELISICGTRLFEEKYIPAALSLKIVRILAKRIVGFLQNREQSSTLSLIQNGEDNSVEFKSTLRLNIHTNEFDKRIELACLKTIAAFLNSSGGTLLIGVDDSGQLLGLENDRFKNTDKMMLHVTSLVKSSMGELNNQYIKIQHVTINEQELVRVDCRPARSPVYLKWQNDEYFYTRSGPSTAELNLSSIYTYISDRFKDR
ncbi:MAG: CRP-like cAMP-binding protein [Patiriisocius sp.]|jgi:CRP-like cAMP-binding protein